MLTFEDVMQLVSVFFVIMLILYILFRNDFSLEEIDNVAIAISFFLAVYAGVELYRLFSEQGPPKSAIVCDGKVYDGSRYKIENGLIVIDKTKKIPVSSGRCRYIFDQD